MHFHRTSPLKAQVVEVLPPLANATEQVLRDILGDVEPVVDDTFADLLAKLDQITLLDKR